MRHRSVTAVLLSSILTLAGCIGGDGGEEEVDETMRDTDDTSGNRTTPTRNVTTNRTYGTNATSSTNTTSSPSTPQNTTQVEEEQRTGTASSFNLLILSDETEEPFDVAQGATLLVIEISITGDDTAVCITAPDGEECEEELDVEEGANVTFNASRPAPGEWMVGLTPQGLGEASADYQITFQVTTTSNGTANGSSGGAGSPSPTGGSPTPTTSAPSPTTTATGTTRPTNTTR